MKAVIFGATGFIGSHVAEQLFLVGHDVLAPVRKGSNHTFLDTLGISTVEMNFSDSASVERTIAGCDTVFNCTASVGASLVEARAVDVTLTERLMRAAAQFHTKRFVQLSTIVVYGFDIEANPADESMATRARYRVTKIAVEREQIVRKIGRETGLEYVILRPASTIGVRDKLSFFSRIFEAHAANAYPLIDGGKHSFSCVDTRDIGRAMEWLARYPEAAGETYLLRGFEFTWAGLKDLLDQHRGVIAKTVNIPRWFAMPYATLQEHIMRNPQLTRYAVDALSRPRVWNDRKIRQTGFHTRYGPEASVRDALADFTDRSTEPGGQR